MPDHIATEHKKCLNCETAISGNFCPQCGQASSTGQITFKETFNNFLSIVFAFEGPLRLTVRLLITNPGKLFREYIAGQRKTYYKPVAFFILITAVYIIIRALIGFDPLADESIQNDLGELANDYPKTREVARLISANINNLFFLLVFSIALMLKLFFRKNYNLAEYTSIALFITGFYTLVKIITMFIGRFSTVEVGDLELWILIVLIFYSSFSLFRKKNFLSIVKYVMVSVFSLVLYIMFGVVFFFIIVSLK